MEGAHFRDELQRYGTSSSNLLEDWLDSRLALRRLPPSPTLSDFAGSPSTGGGSPSSASNGSPDKAPDADDVGPVIEWPAGLRRPAPRRATSTLSAKTNVSTRSSLSVHGEYTAAHKVRVTHSQVVTTGGRSTSRVSALSRGCLAPSHNGAGDPRHGDRAAGALPPHRLVAVGGGQGAAGNRRSAQEGPGRSRGGAAGGAAHAERHPPGVQLRQAEITRLPHLDRHRKRRQPAGRRRRRGRFRRHLVAQEVRAAARQRERRRRQPAREGRRAGGDRAAAVCVFILVRARDRREPTRDCDRPLQAASVVRPQQGGRPSDEAAAAAADGAACGGARGERRRRELFRVLGAMATIDPERLLGSQGVTRFRCLVI